MALNFSQNPQYINQTQTNNNFGAISVPQVQEPASFSILKGMGLPTTGDEFVKFAPFFGISVVLSKLFSAFATVASRVNPLKNTNMTVGETFEKSFLGKMSSKIDSFLRPILDKNQTTISSIKTKAKKITPDWLKNLGEKFKIGVAPKNNMALFQYRGATHAASNAFLEVFTKVKPKELQRLGLEAVSLQRIATDAMQTNTRESVLRAVEKIANELKNVNAKDLQELALASGKKSYLLNELNKARAFIAPTAKTGVSKYLQKGLMYLSEGAGGGVIGGALFGILMNSLFMASTIKRTWEAPWKEKLSTFMEGLIVEFGGIYFTMVLGTRLTYKLLGLKNADKSVKQLNAIKELTETIKASKEEFKDIEAVLKIAKKGKLTPELNEAIREILKTTSQEGLTPEIKKLISKTIGTEPVKQGFWSKLFRKPQKFIDPQDLTKKEIINVFENIREVQGRTINSSIDNLAKMRAFQKIPKGGFFRNLFNRPLRWIGNFLSVGLENLPTKVGVKGVSKFKLFFSKLWNGIKFAGGYPLRFILVTAIVTPPLTKLLGKISHGLFGKPTKSITDEKDEKTAENKTVKNTSSKEQQNIDKMQAYSLMTKQLGELRKAYENQQTQKPLALNNNQISKQQELQQHSNSLLASSLNPTKNNTPIESTKNNDKKTNLSPATYIPNVNVSYDIDNGTINEINQKLAKCNNIEKYALKELDSLKSKNGAYDF